MSDDALPTVEDVYGIHDAVVSQYDLTHDGTQAFLPDRKIRGMIDDARECDTAHLTAATLLRRLINLHAFEDGNKRTAWIVTVTYLDGHGAGTPVEDGEAEVVLKRIRRYDVSELADWLETGWIDDSRLR